MPAGNNGILDGVRRTAGRFRDLVVDGGLPGAPLGYLLRGATASGPPAAGTWPAGAVVPDRKGVLWTCVTAGTPGKWTRAAPDYVNVTAYGADPAGVTDSSAAVNAAYAALGSLGGVLFFPAGTYKITSGIVLSLLATQTVMLAGEGATATTLNYYGSGDCIRMYNALSGTGAATSYFSGIRDMTVDGTAGTGSPVGLHLGDYTFAQVQNVIIQNFTGASSSGLHLDNTVTYTEQGDFRAVISNCTQAVRLEVTTGYNSFAYTSFDLTIYAAAAQSCFCLVNGALLYHSVIKIRGDVNGSATTLSGNPAFVYIAGQSPVGTPNAGSNPGIQACHVDILVEPNNLSGTATHFMSTFYLDNATSFGYFAECYGLLDFSQGTGAFTAMSTAMLPGNSSNFNSFSGIVAGDSNINPSGTYGWNTWGNGGILNYLPGYSNYDGYFPTCQADVFSTTLDGGSSTVALNYSAAGNGGNTLAGPQRKLLYIRQPASGGPYPLTWPTSGTPTVSAPTVLWPGGAPPALQPVASGTDVIELLTYDGATWHGRHVRSYGTATAQTVALAPERQRVTLTTAFTSGTGTTAQNVTGLSAYLAAGTYRLTGWFPMAAAGTTGSTQKLAFTFGGTASSGYARWLVTGATSSTTSAGNAVTTASSLSPTMTSTGLVGEFAGQVTVTAAGTLQLTVTSTTSGDEATFPVGCFIDIEPLI